MKGDWFVYNFGGSVKDFGERMAHVRLLGVPLFRWCCDPVIRLGLNIKDSVMGRPVQGWR